MSALHWILIAAVVVYLCTGCSRQGASNDEMAAAKSALENFYANCTNGVVHSYSTTTFTVSCREATPK